MSKTNTGLVNYAKAQIGKPYWYGTFGNTATESLLNAKKKQYPSHYQSGRMSKYRSQLGMRVHDCVGLIKGYLWSENETAKPEYNAAQDVSANGMRKKCTENGKIATLPEIPGILVFMNGHVGIYAGGGKVIEARGFAYGVVVTELADRKWTSWGKCPWIEYPSAKAIYFPKCDSACKSIVDGLKEVKANSGFAYRKSIAAINGITDYVGTAQQNIKMLNLLKQGKLMKP